MSSRLSFARPLAFAAMLLAASASQATITVYTTQASFMAAVSGWTMGTDTFDDLIPATATPDGPLSRTAGSFSYDVSSAPNSPILYGAGSGADPWLSTNAAADTITFSGFAPGVYAAGAYVFGSDIAGDFLRRGAITMTATDGDGTSSLTKRFALQTNFIGFVSDSGLTSVSVYATDGIIATVWPTVNDLTLAGPVPEPETYALLLAGLGVVGFVARRRRQS